MVTKESNGIYVSHINDDVYADGVEFTLSISLNRCYDVSRHLDDFPPDDNAGNYRKGVLLNYVGFQVLRHEGANVTLENNPSGWVDVTAWVAGSSVGSDCVADKYGNGDISIRVGNRIYTPASPEALFTKYSPEDEPYSYWYNGVVSDDFTDIEYAVNFGSYFSACDWADADFQANTLGWFASDEERASHRGLDSDDDTSATVEIRYKFPDTYPYGDWQESDQHTYCIIFKYPVSENEWGSEISYIQPYDENNVISYRTQLLTTGDYAHTKCNPVNYVSAEIASSSVDYDRYDLSIRCRDGIDTANASAKFYLQVVKENAYRITSSSGEGGSITPVEGTVYAPKGSDRRYTVVPDEGYCISEFLVDGQASVLEENNNYTFRRILGDHAIHAKFAVAYNIRSSVNGTGGTIEPLGTIVVPEGETRVYVVTPDEGYVVDSVTVDDISQTLVGNTYTFENVQSNHTIIVSFTEAPEPPANTVTFHCFDIIEGETVILDGDPTGEVVQDGTSLAFGIAHPLASGDAFKFIPLSGLFITELHLGGVDGESIMESLVPDRTYIFGEVDGDKEVYVRFNKDGAIDVATLEYPTGAGETTGSGQYSYSESVEVSATPNANYEFLDWTNDGEVVYTERTYPFDVYESVILTANFASTLPRYSVGVTASPAGGGTVTGGGEYDEGSLVTIVAEASEGYHFVAWLDGNDEPVSTDPTYSFTVNSDMTFVAQFDINQYTINVGVSSMSGFEGAVGCDDVPTHSGDFQVNGVQHGSTPVFYVKKHPDGGIESVVVDMALATERVVTGELVATQYQNQYTYTLPPVTGDCSVDFRFNKDGALYILLDIVPSGAGTVTANGQSVSANSLYSYDGQVVEFHAVPSAGSSFEGWSIDGVQVSADADMTYVQDGSEHIIEAVFT